MKTLSRSKKALESALIESYRNELEVKIVAMPFDNLENSLDQLIEIQEVKIVRFFDCLITPNKIAKDLIKSVLDQDGAEEVYEIVVSVTIDNNETEWFLTVRV